MLCEPARLVPVCPRRLLRDRSLPYSVLQVASIMVKDELMKWGRIVDDGKVAVSVVVVVQMVELEG